MKRVAMACCKIYVSASRNAKVLERIEQAAAVHSQGAPLVHVFKDEHYNRVGYTLAGEVDAENPPLHDAVVGVVQAAVENIDIREHCGSHPRLGAVDNVCFHPLAGGSMKLVAALAKRCASTISNRLQGTFSAFLMSIHVAVPAFLYGAASEDGDTLVHLRRSLGYFSGGKSNTSAAGVVTVGATPWISNYNVPVSTRDVGKCRDIARLMASELPHLQAMALAHGCECVEIACNLLNDRVTTAAMVQSHAQALASERSLVALPGYSTSPGEDDILELACSKLY